MESEARVLKRRNLTPMPIWLSVGFSFAVLFNFDAKFVRGAVLRGQRCASVPRVWGSLMPGLSLLRGHGLLHTLKWFTCGSCGTLGKALPAGGAALGTSVSLDMSSQGSLGSRVALLLAIARAAAVFLPPGRNTRGVLSAPAFGAGFSRAVATGVHDTNPEFHDGGGGFGTAEVVALAAASAYFRSRPAAKLPVTTAGRDPSCGGVTSGGACLCCR